MPHRYTVIFDIASFAIALLFMGSIAAFVLAQPWNSPIDAVVGPLVIPALLVIGGLLVHAIRRYLSACRLQTRVRASDRTIAFFESRFRELELKGSGVMDCLAGRCLPTPEQRAVFEAFCPRVPVPLVRLVLHDLFPA